MKLPCNFTFTLLRLPRTSFLPRPSYEEHQKRHHHENHDTATVCLRCQPGQRLNDSDHRERKLWTIVARKFMNLNNYLQLSSRLQSWSSAHGHGSTINSFRRDAQKPDVYTTPAATYQTTMAQSSTASNILVQPQSMPLAVGVDSYSCVSHWAITPSGIQTHSFPPLWNNARDLLGTFGVP